MSKNTLALVIILVLGSLGQIAADLYLPSLPAIAHEFQNNVNLAQWSVSVYLIGYAVSQLFYGPLSDSIGRKTPLGLSLTILIIGCIVSSSASTIYWLIAGRLIQGIGAGGSYALSRSILRDYYSDTRLARSASFISGGSVALIAAAPLLGGYLQEGFGWRSNFIFLAIYSLIILILSMLKLPESNIHKNIANIKLKQWLLNLKGLFTHRVFSRLVLIVFITYAGVFSWLTSGSILLQSQIGISPADFGWIILACGASYCIGIFFNARFVIQAGIYKMLRIGVAILFVSGLLMLLLAFFIKPLNLWTVVIPIWMYMLGTGFIFPNTYAGALTPFAKIAGLAGSTYGFMQFLGGASASGLFAEMGDHTQFPLAGFILGCALVNLIIIFSFRNSLKPS